MVDLSQFTPPDKAKDAPEYLRYSHPSEQPGPNIGPGQVLKTIGEGIQEGATMADTIQEGYVKDQTRKMGDSLMDQAVADFEPTYRKLNNIPDNTTVNPDDVKDDLRRRMANPADPINNPGGPLPDALNNGLNRAADLQGMSNKANNTFDATYFQGRVRAALKDLRQRFPTRRDIIDRTMQETTGEAGANDYWRGMMANINSYITKQDQMRKEQTNQVVSWGKDGLLSPENVRDFLAGKLSFEQAAINMSGLAWSTHSDARANTNRGYSITADEDSLRRNFAVIGNRAMSNVAVATGAQDVPTLMRNLNDIVDGKTQATQPQRDALLAQLDQAIQKTQAEMYRFASQNAPSGQPYNATISDKVGPMIAAQLKELTDFRDAMKNGEYGAAKGLLTAMNAGQTDMTYHFYNSVPGKMAMMIAAARKIDPKAADQIALSLNRNQEWDHKYDAHVQDWLNKFLAQPDKNNPTVIRDALDDMRNQIIRAHGDPNDPKNAAMLEGLTRITESLKYATNDTARKNILDSMFNYRNQGMVGYFGKNSLQYNNGGVTVRPGQYDIFRRMLDPEVVREAHRIGGETWDNTVNFAENTFGHQLLPQALKDMGNIRLNSDERLAWDDKAHQFYIQKNIGGHWTSLDDYTQDPGRPRYNERFVNQPGSALYGRAFPGFTDPHTRFTLGLINRGIRTMEPIANEQGKDMSQYVYDLLTANNVDLHNVDAPGGAMAASIRAAADRALQDRQQQEERRAETMRKAGGEDKIHPIAPPRVHEGPDPTQQLPPYTPQDSVLNERNLLDYAKRHPQYFNAGPQ